MNRGYVLAGCANIYGLVFFRVVFYDFRRSFLPILFTSEYPPGRGEASFHNKRAKFNIALLNQMMNGTLNLKFHSSYLNLLV